MASLNEICEECKYYGCSECVPPKCNIGFSLKAIKSSHINGEKSINDGVKLIPKNVAKQNQVFSNKIKTEYIQME